MRGAFDMIQANEFAAGENAVAEGSDPTQSGTMAMCGSIPGDTPLSFYEEPDRARQILGDVLRDAVLPRLIAQALDRP
jgi:hypothetical protein